jgi:hypothetical protein
VATLNVLPVFAEVTPTHVDTSALDRAAASAEDKFPTIPAGPMYWSDLNAKIDELRYYRQFILPRFSKKIIGFCNELENEQREINEYVATNQQADGANLAQQERLSVIKQLRYSCLTASAAKLEKITTLDSTYWELYYDLDAISLSKFIALRDRRGDCILETNGQAGKIQCF